MSGPTLERLGSLDCLLLIARLHGLGPPPPFPGHLGAGVIEAGELADLARQWGLRPRWSRPGLRRLATQPLPALAVMEDQRCLVLAGVRDNAVLVQAPGESPTVLPKWQFAARWRGELLLLRPVHGGAVGEGAAGSLLAVAREQRQPLFEVLIATLFLQLLALVAPLLFQVVIDKVLVHQRMNTLDVLCAGLLAAGLFEAVLGTVRGSLLAHASTRLDVLLGARLLRHLLALPLAWFEARRVGDTLACVRELDQLRAFLTGPALTLGIDLLFALGFFVLLFGYHERLASVVLAGLAVHVLLVVALTPGLRRRLEARAGRHADVQALLVESLGAIPTLKAAAAEDAQLLRWQRLAVGAAEAGRAATGWSNVLAQGSALIQKLATVATLWLGARLVIAGELSVGELVGFNLVAARILQPALRLAQCWQEWQQVGVAFQRLDGVMKTLPEPTSQQPEPAAPCGEIRFEDVFFRYRPQGPDVLRGFSFHLPAGAVVGIVGASGSGKSTLASLVQRLYAPRQGRILLDGMPIALSDPRCLRRQLGVVPQDTRIFNRSVRENIALRDPGAPLEEVVRAAALAGAEGFILDLPEGYDTVLGEHGVALSGGQRQRLALARALLGNPRVLILDEATAALDYEAEALFMRQLPRFAAGRTVLLIAHRLTTVRQAERILVLDRGVVAEHGSHAELLARGGRYARLWALQSRDPDGVAA